MSLIFIGDKNLADGQITDDCLNPAQALNKMAGWYCTDIVYPTADIDLDATYVDNLGLGCYAVESLAVPADRTAITYLEWWQSSDETSDVRKHLTDVAPCSGVQPQIKKILASGSDATVKIYLQKVKHL